LNVVGERGRGGRCVCASGGSIMLFKFNTISIRY